MSVITIRGLVKEYPRTTDLLQLFRRRFQDDVITALRGIDLELTPGRIYGLVGPNGAGKTTLLKIISGLALPTKGEVLVDGRSIVGNPRARGSIGFVETHGTGTTFADLADSEQIAILETVDQEPYFGLIQFATVVGMFSHPKYGGNKDRMGWELLGFEDRHAWQPPFGHYDAEVLDEQ